jgi:hypothetical protein
MAMTGTLIASLGNGSRRLLCHGRRIVSDRERRHFTASQGTLRARRWPLFDFRHEPSDPYLSTIHPNSSETVSSTWILTPVRPPAVGPVQECLPGQVRSMAPRRADPGLSRCEGLRRGSSGVHLRRSTARAGSARHSPLSKRDTSLAAGCTHDTLA